MNAVIEALLAGSILVCGAVAQDSYKPVLTKGVAVKMPVAAHSVEMRAADEPGATVVAITADGTVYVGVKRTEPVALSSLDQGTVYVKADSRVPYQVVLTVLDALRGKSVVLLAATPDKAPTHGIVPPYGLKLVVSNERP